MENSHRKSEGFGTFHSIYQIVFVFIQYKNPRPMQDCEKSYKRCDGLKYHLDDAHESTEEMMVSQVLQMPTVCGEKLARTVQRAVKAE